MSFLFDVRRYAIVADDLRITRVHVIIGKRLHVPFWMFVKQCIEFRKGLEDVIQHIE